MASFDGTNKASTGKGQNIAYHAATSPTMEKIKQEAMAKASPEAIAYLDPLHYKGAKVVVDASTLTDVQWQAMRQRSIGSSAIGQVFGDSPYDGCTNIDLYNQKIGMVPIIQEARDEKDRKEALFLYGHLMEEFLHLKTQQKFKRAKLFVDTNIYADPKRPYLTANLDRMMQLSDGSYVHVEFKTTSQFGKDAYEGGAIPPHYKRQLIQCQHIMGVWRSILVVAFSRDDIGFYTYDRDLDEEYEQILGAEDFWLNHVLPQIPPEPIGSPDNLIKAIRRYNGYGDKKKPEITLDTLLMPDAKRLFDVSSKIRALNAEVKRLQKEKERAMIGIAQAMGQTTRAYITDGNEAFNISWTPRSGKRICDFERLKLNYPDVYAQFVTQAAEESRPMSISRTATK